jgi:hypothetical protein
VLKPTDDRSLGIFVEENLAAMLQLAVHDKRPSERDGLGQIFPVTMAHCTLLHATAEPVRRDRNGVASPIHVSMKKRRAVVPAGAAAPS